MRNRFLLTLFLGALAGSAVAGEPAPHAHHGGKSSAAAPVFVASTAKPFAALMGDAMAVMDDGMRRAPATGDPGHDFVTMMIPHHQGAIDMAKAVLLHTTDPELMNLAQGILTEQQNEIRVMQAWLRRHSAPAPHARTRQAQTH